MKENSDPHTRPNRKKPIDKVGDTPKELLVLSTQVPDSVTNSVDLVTATLVGNAQVHQQMQTFMLAWFYLTVSRMPDEEFEALCRTTKAIIAGGCRNINALLKEVPEPFRAIFQDRGVLPNKATVAENMRTYREAEKQLIEARKSTQSNYE